MKEIGYYPGCSLDGTAKEYEKSLQKVFSALEIKVKDIEDWSCCGATSAHATNHFLANALSARNLSLSANQGFTEVLAPCAACYNRLVHTKHELEEKPELKSKIEDSLQEKISTKTEVLNILQILQRMGTDSIISKKKVDLKGLKVACYYGCLLLRPHDITHFDDPEAPVSFEELVKSLGATTVEWNFRTECCGGSHSIPQKNIAVELSQKIIDDAAKHGADIIVTACPMCHSNLDMRQVEMKKRNENHKTIPVLYISELMGLAFGFTQKELGIDLHFIDAGRLVKTNEGVTA
jgi:heterodisulfide reductase subunit B2